MDKWGNTILYLYEVDIEFPRRRAEEVKEEQKHRVYMENRMSALLELKNDIEASQVYCATHY